MPILNKLTGAFPTALIYITIGTLITVWTLVYWVLNTSTTPTGYFWVVGFFLTGVSLLLIGLMLGKIGRAARSAELPPAEVTSAAVQADLISRLAAPAATVAPASPALPPTQATAAVGAVPAAGVEPAAPVVSAAPAVVAKPVVLATPAEDLVRRISTD